MSVAQFLRRTSAIAIIGFFSGQPFSFSPPSTNSFIPVLYDSSNNLHRDLRYHPEQPARIDACVDALMAYAPIASIFDLAPDAPSDAVVTSIVGHISREHLSPLELERARSLLVDAHSENYVSKLEERCRNSRRKRIEEGRNPLGFVGYVDDDTYLTTESFDVCLRAAGAWARGVDLLFDGRGGSGFRNAVALTRPPGHHATSSFANGFCLFNFAAAAMRHALSSGYARRVSVLDWDVHYGQGVADIVRTKEWGRDCRYVSMHQVPAFPYEGERRGFAGEFKNVLTVPIQPDSTWTCGYQDAFTQYALPFVRDDQGTWDPDLVIVCAGYDGLDSDELASTSLTAEDYGKMARLLRERIGPDTKVLVGLEGGYQLKERAAGGNLADAVVETVMALAELNG